MISRQLRDQFLSRYVPRSQRLSKAFRLTENLRARPELYHLFDPGVVTTSNVVFIDVCGSAKATSSMSAAQVKKYLDEFYRVVIPEIYERGGEIDQLIGDGIVAVFGPPFLGQGATATASGLSAAVECSRSVISKLAYTPLTVKCAVRQGELCFTAVGDHNYHELTMVGNTLAELHRLESVSADQAINVFAGTTEQRRVANDPSLSPCSSGTSRPHWSGKRKPAGDLKGVDFTEVYYEEYIDPSKTTPWRRSPASIFG